MALKDDAFYETLCELIKSKLRGAGEVDEDELVESIADEHPEYETDDVYEAIIILETQEIVERSEIGDATFIEVVE